MKTLMHICCAPCANRPIAALREEGIELAGFWYNPNIHPYTEYRSRKTCLEDYAREISLPLVVVNDYGLRQIVQHVADNIDGRCAYCYRVRMEETARYAAEHGFDSFTTSLLISPYQNHEAICAVARAMGGEYGVEFLYRDFRPLFPGGAAVCPGPRLLYAEILRLCVQRGGPISGQEAKKRGGAPGRRPAERAGLTPAQIIAVGLPRKKPRRVRSRRREFSSDPFSPATCVSGKTLLRLPV